MGDRAPGATLCLLAAGWGAIPKEDAVEDRDVYILLDRSGSMSGKPWEAACRAVESFAKKLPSSTRIHLTLFESSHTNFTAKPVPASECLTRIGRCASSLIALGVTGGTALAPALDEVFSLRNQHSAGQPAVILLITDGMVGNERAIVDRARRSGTTLHFVGIGCAPNDALKTAAQATGGQSVFCSPSDHLEPIFARFASRLSKPVFDRVPPPQGWILDDDSSPISLYQGEQRLLVMRGEPGARLESMKAFRGDSVVEIEVNVINVKNEALPRLWARQRIRHLESRGRSDRSESLSLEFNLPSSRTSFVAWDREEQVTVAARHLHQPSSHIEDRMESISPGRQYSKGLSSGMMGSIAPPDFERIARKSIVREICDDPSEGFEPIFEECEKELCMEVEPPREAGPEIPAIESRIFEGRVACYGGILDDDSDLVPLASKPKATRETEKKVPSLETPKVDPSLQVEKDPEKKRGLLGRIIRKIFRVILEVFGLSRAK